MTASISLRGVSQRFGATWALTDIDLDLVPGATGQLGPNGAGKTTLLRLFATALAPTQGRVSVLGWDPAVPAQRTGIRRRLGYLPQEIGFPRGFSGFAFVDYVAVLKEWAQPAARHAEVRRVLGQVGLCGDPAKQIRAMSGGARGRVALAQALLGAPRVPILDEPTAGVDSEQRVMLRTVLAELTRTSTVVLSTHQTEGVAALCERVIVLDRGERGTTARSPSSSARPPGTYGWPTSPIRPPASRGAPAPGVTAMSASVPAPMRSTSSPHSRMPASCCCTGPGWRRIRAVAGRSGHRRGGVRLGGGVRSGDGDRPHARHRTCRDRPVLVSTAWLFAVGNRGTRLPVRRRARVARAGQLIAATILGCGALMLAGFAGNLGAVWSATAVAVLAWLAIPVWVLALGRTLVRSRSVLPETATVAV